MSGRSRGQTEENVNLIEGTSFHVVTSWLHQKLVYHLIAI